MRRQVKDLALELGILGLDLDVLDDHSFVIEPHGIGQQECRIDGTLFGLVNREVFERASVDGLDVLREIASPSPFV